MAAVGASTRKLARFGNAKQSPDTTCSARRGSVRIAKIVSIRFREFLFHAWQAHPAHDHWDFIYLVVQLFDYCRVEAGRWIGQRDGGPEIGRLEIRAKAQA